MNAVRIAFSFAVLALAACTPSPPAFDKLNIETVETGGVPPGTIPNLPAEEGVVVYRRMNAGILEAAYRKTIPCPSRMIFSTSGIKALPDKILLCHDPIEPTSPEAQPLSACPYEYAIKFEMRGIPESVEPKFEIAKSCAGF